MPPVAMVYSEVICDSARPTNAIVNGRKSAPPSDVKHAPKQPHKTIRASRIPSLTISG
jgi:hypothetical protein